MTREEALRYAQDWADHWNERDLEAVLAHFAEDVRFTSPKALAMVGAPTVRGKAELRAYWTTALRTVRSLRFSVRRILWDPESAELSIFYDREIDGKQDRASEVLRFGASGRVVQGEVLYGITPVGDPAGS